MPTLSHNSLSPSSTPPHQYRIFISAGEASGDLHASNLVKKVKLNTCACRDVRFYGMGGTLMRQAGVEILVDSTELAVVGGIEVLRHAGKILKAMRTIKRTLKANPPHLLILVDYPGFNLWLAKVAKKLSIKILYYISPQIWAWHQSRVHKIRRLVDMMAVVFPFEVAFYTKAKVPVTLVRHPLLDIVKPTPEKSTTQRAFNLKPSVSYGVGRGTNHGAVCDAITVGLFPGSRSNEIKYLLPMMLQAAELLKNRYQEKNTQVQFVLPLASSLSEEALTPYLQQHSQLGVHVIKNQPYDTVMLCDAIIATSGTVTLEIALLAVPMVIVYKISALTYWIAKKVIKIPYIGLCNIVAERKIVQELIQNEASAQNIAAEVARILEDKDYRNNMVCELQQVRQKLDISNNTKDIAAVVINMLDA